MESKIKDAYSSAKNYPDLVAKLIAIGAQSYTVDVSTGTILYRFADGENLIHPGITEPRLIRTVFNKELTIEAVRHNQQGKTDYPSFMDEIAIAGVRFYEATLTGTKKRVTYIGNGGFYEEVIPI